MNDKKILAKINKPKRNIEATAIAIILIIVVASIVYNYLYLH